MNSKRSTGPKTPEGKAVSRFNALIHGCRAEAAILPGEDPEKFRELHDKLHAAWLPQDDFEKTMVDQIAVNQWKLARLDAAEANIYDPGVLSAAEFAMAIQRLSITQNRLERSISRTIVDLEHYRKDRLQRQKDLEPKGDGRGKYTNGLLWRIDGRVTYHVLPKVRGLDGEWRVIPRSLLGDLEPPPGHPDYVEPIVTDPQPSATEPRP